MKKILIVILLGFYIISAGCDNSDRKVKKKKIPGEREALIALYNSTDGDGWNWDKSWKAPPLHTDGFALPQTECKWYGVKCNEEKKVVELNFSREPCHGKNCGDGPMHGVLSGNIPPQLEYLTNLEYLFLGWNNLKGAIPKELGNLKDLKWINLEFNQLSGKIPPQLSNLTKLTCLDLYSNNINGTIPKKLAQLKNMEILDLDGNNLSGKIPLQLINLSNIKELFLCYNYLECPSDKTLVKFLDEKDAQRAYYSWRNQTDKYCSD